MKDLIFSITLTSLLISIHFILLTITKGKIQKDEKIPIRLLNWHLFIDCSSSQSPMYQEIYFYLVRKILHTKENDLEELLEYFSKIKSSSIFRSMLRNLSHHKDAKPYLENLIISYLHPPVIQVVDDRLRKILNFKYYKELKFYYPVYEIVESTDKSFRRAV